MYKSVLCDKYTTLFKQHNRFKKVEIFYQLQMGISKNQFFIILSPAAVTLSGVEMSSAG